MSLLWSQWANSGWLAGMGALGLVALVMGAVAWQRRASPWRRVLAGTAVALVLGTVVIAVAAAEPSHPNWRLKAAVDEVQRAAASPAACEQLDEALVEAPPEAVAGTPEAILRCVERALGEALALPDGREREQALLALAAGDARLTPSTPQLDRIVAATGETRVAVRSIEVSGPLAIAEVRRHMAKMRIYLRGCQARSGLLTPSLPLALTLSAEGVVEAARATSGDEDLDRCFAAALTGSKIAAAEVGSRVTLDLALREPEAR